MPRLCCIAALILSLLLFAACGATVTQTVTPTATGAQYQVVIGDDAYNPPRLTIKTGDTVSWLNQSSQRQGVLSLYHFQDEDDVSHLFFGESWDSGLIEPGQSYSRTFSQAGLYEYIGLPLKVRLPNDQYRDFIKGAYDGVIIVE
jgi:plastocyanin